MGTFLRHSVVAVTVKLCRNVNAKTNKTELSGLPSAVMPPCVVF